MGLLRRIRWTWLVALGACTTEVGVDLSRVDGPRVLAVAATPAEAAPGDAVELRALWVDEDGGHPEESLGWSLCTTRRPLTELAPVASGCIDGDPDAGTELGDAPSVVAEIPADACRWFGPDPPPAEPGEPQGRPVEPDRTGGYYQPVIVQSDDVVDGYGVRIDCGIAGATQAQAAELRRRHRDNVAPSIAVRTDVDGGDAPSRRLTVAPGEVVALRAEWPACDGTASCGGAERYAVLDPESLEIVVRREAIGVAWYATDGSFDAARTGRAADDEVRSTKNEWTAPEEIGAVTIWVVVRDDRGGVSWQTLHVEVR